MNSNIHRQRTQSGGSTAELMRCAVLALVMAAALGACMDSSGCGMGSGYSIGGGALSSCPSTMTPVPMVNPADHTALTSSLSGTMKINNAPMFYYAATALPTGTSAVTLGISGATAVAGGSTSSYTIAVSGNITTLYCTIQGATGSLYYPGYGIPAATGTLTITWPVFSQAAGFVLRCSGLDTASNYTAAATISLSGS